MLESRELLTLTPQLVDINAAPATVAFRFLTPTPITEMGGAAYFYGQGNSNAGYALWKSDGTANGTLVVKDMSFAPGFGDIREITNVGGKLFFSAQDGVHGRELWSSDGTSSGTMLVKDIATGALGSNPTRLTNVNGELFFVASDGESGSELWVSDGTEGGTFLVSDIKTGSESSYPGNLTSGGGTLFFTANDGTSGTELWRSDGSPQGTGLVSDIQTGGSSSSPTMLTNVNGTVFFSANDGVTGIDLWAYKSNTGVVGLVKDLVSAPGALTNVNGKLFFSSGGQIWVSDGMNAGTVALNGIGVPHDLTAVGSTLFFFNRLGGRDQIWTSDGTAAGTLIVNSPFDDIALYAANIAGTLYFTTSLAYDHELWKSDGTSGGTVVVSGLPSSPINLPPLFLTDVNGKLFLAATNGGNGHVLWASDGTTAGTRPVPKDTTTTGSSGPNIQVIDDEIFFSAIDGVHGFELWKSDGTSAGTALIKDINSGEDGSFPREITNVNNLAFFSIQYGPDALSGIWKSDGTTDGTVFVANTIGPPQCLTSSSSNLFFVSDRELWKTDVNLGGITRLSDSADPLLSFCDYLGIDGILFYEAADSEHGTEPWRSDGTPEGTFLLKDLLPGSGSR